MDLHCLDDRGEDTCVGTVEYRSVDGIRAFPRCERHFDLHLDWHEDHLSKWGHPDAVAPSWCPEEVFLGDERWDDEY